MELLEALGTRVRDKRVTRGWTQRALAERAGLSLRFLGQLEGGKANISVTRLAELSRALGVSMSSLVAGLEPADKLALIGLRGAGKSTIGARAAAELGCAFVVLDDRIRDRTGLSLADIFEMHGPEGYHRLCREALVDVVAEPGPAVLEIGGSVVGDEGSWRILTERTRTIWLRASPEAHLQRVADQGDTRPMTGFGDALGELQGLLRVREPLYERASVVADTERLGLEGSVQAVVHAAAPPSR